MQKPLLLLALSGLAVAGCNGKADKKDCEEMLDRYLDMVMAGEPDMAKLSPQQQKVAREMKRAIRKSEPSYRKVAEQCEAEITKKEYRCAMAADNPDVWQSCID